MAVPNLKLLDPRLAPEEGLDALRAGIPFPALSEERDSRQELEQDMGLGDIRDPEVEHALSTLYGDEFPLLKGAPQEEDWVGWARALWQRHSASMTAKLHLVERNRLFRRGHQWVSSKGMFGPWREPPRPRDSARVVCNMIAPALDMRVQIVSEQRPGPRTRPATQDPEDVKKAEAQQFALDYQIDQQEMPEAMRENEYWAGTDGVSFWELFWDPERGPWHEVQVDQQGNVQPKGVEPPQGGMPGAGMPQQAQKKFRLGDVSHRCRRIEQVRVSAGATATKKPWYWVIKELMPKAEAIREYGIEVAKDVGEAASEIDSGLGLSNLRASRLGFGLPGEEELLLGQERIDRITVYCEPSEYLEKGLTLIVIGDKVVFGPSGLLFGVVPMVRFTDGSSDPSFFPQPVMDDWIDAQMRINALKSKWVENIRGNAGPKLLATENSIVGETLVGSSLSVVSVRGLGGVQNSVRPLEGMSLAADAKELFAIEKKNFEDLSGHNDAMRGSFSPDQSGRAILAIREQLERMFAPMVNAAARAMTDWAKITLSIMKWGYDIPRTLAVEGKSRPDLARALSSDDFDGVCDVFIDPETMMPMPRALRLFLLDDLFQKGLLGIAEYRRRVPFAFVGSLSSPDTDQEARARRVVEALRLGQWPEILWVDDEAIHQDVLQRELILPDDTPPQLRQMAIQRWQMLAQQSMMKQGVLPQQPPSPPSGPNGKQSQNTFAGAAGMTPQQQPLMSTNPSVATPPGNTDVGTAARSFDARQQH